MNDFSSHTFTPSLMIVQDWKRIQIKWKKKQAHKSIKCVIIIVARMINIKKFEEKSTKKK